MKKLVKLIYKRIPFKKQIFILLRMVWKPKESIYRHLYFKGVFKISTTQRKKFKMMHYGFQLENDIFWTGIKSGWEKKSVTLWTKLCSEAKVIFDIGANTGIYSLIAKSLNSHAKVFAFEPVKRVFDKLLYNNSLNKFDIHCIPDAVSNLNGTAKFYDTPTEHIYSVTINKNLHNPNIFVIETEVKTITMDSIVEQYGLQQIDLMKIDVETHEPEVLEGFKKYLPQFRPSILIEILNDEVARKIEASVTGLGYLYFNIDETKGIRQTDHIERSDYYNYFLCSPDIAKKMELINA